MKRPRCVTVGSGPSALVVKNFSNSGATIASASSRPVVAANSACVEVCCRSTMCVNYTSFPLPLKPL